MSDFVVVPNTFSGWDVMHGEDPIAVSNHSDQRSAMAAARIFLAEEHHPGAVRLDTEHPHGIDDPSTGVRSAFIVRAADDGRSGLGRLLTGERGERPLKSRAP